MEAYDVALGGAGVPLTGDESRQSWPATYQGACAADAAAVLVVRPIHRAHRAMQSPAITPRSAKTCTTMQI